MSSDLAIIDDAVEIMSDLPSQLQNDSQMMECVIEGLNAGLQKHEVRIIANEAAIARLEKTVSYGFGLVNQEIQGIKHDAQIDRVHAEYARRDAQEAKAEVAQLWRSLWEVQTTAKVAEAKAEGAKDVAKTSNRFMGFDPLLTVLTCAIALTAIFVLISIRIEKKEEPKGSIIKCGEDVQCTYNGNPANYNQAPSKFKGGV